MLRPILTCLVMLLAAAGVAAAPADRDRALIAAAGAGDAASVRRLLQEGAGVHAADERGVTDRTQQSAFLIATSDGHVDLLRLTIEAGADVRGTDSYDGTGLIRAADRGHVEVIRELLKTPIPLDHVNRLGWTALLEAVILGDGGPRHTTVVKLLVEAGASVNIADSGGVSPLAHARARGFTAIAGILEAKGGR